MVRWLMFSVAVVALAAVGTVASFYLAPSTSSSIAPLRPTSTDAKGRGGKAVVEGNSTVFDFGILPQKTQSAHSWTIANQGKGDLVLEVGQVTCSCTNVDLDTGQPITAGYEVTLKPGEKKAFKINFNTKEWDKFHQVAPIIVHNDPNVQQIDLTIDGIVRPAVMTYPADKSVIVSTIGNDISVVRDVALFSFDRPDLKVLDVQVSDPKALSVEQHDMTADECKQFKITKGKRLTITVKPTPKLGQFTEEISVKLDHPMQDLVKFTVIGRREGPISVIPGTVRMFNIDAKRGATETLTLLVRGREQTKFTFEHKPKAVEVAIEPMGQVEGSKVQRYQLTIKVPPNSPHGTISDDIILKTDHPGALEVKIPVTIVVGQSS